jgi:hypothetical protein
MISAMFCMNMKRKYSSPDSVIVGLFIYGFIMVLSFNGVFVSKFRFCVFNISKGDVVLTVHRR